MLKVVAIAAAVAAMAVAGAANAADKLILQLHGPAQFEFAGYYAALWQGFYRDAGLSVEIKPGAGRGEKQVDPVREVTEGRAQFGTGTAGLVVRTAQGLPLLLLAPIFQRSGAGVYYRADEDYASPGALADATVGRLPASNILDIELATALKAEGVEPDKLKSVPLQPERTVAALAERNVAAVPGSAWELPWLAHEKNFAVKSFNPADYRVEFYGDTLFTLQRLARDEPAVVQRFRAASLKGWEYALQHPEEISARLVSDLPAPPGIGDPAGFNRYQAKLARALARYPGVPLGHSNPVRWNRIQASMIGVGALLHTAEPSDFVYDPDAAARNRNDRRSFAILGATLFVALLITAWFWRRGRRRTAAPVATAAQPAAATAPATAVAPAPASAKPAAAAAAPAAPAASPEPKPREPVPELAPADLNIVLARMDRAIRQRVPRRAKYRLSLLPELWHCRAAPQTVRALVLDLVAGAASGLKGDGELIVGTRNFAFDEARLAATPGAQLGQWVRVTVRDNGPGLSDDALDRVFDPAATARPSAAAAAAAMRAHGGFARVESAEGIGTAVHLYFPRAAAESSGKAAAE